MKLCPRCGRLFPEASTVCSGEGAALALRSALPADPFVGRTIEGFVVERWLQDGRSSSVYVARDPETGREVGLKRFTDLLAADAARIATRAALAELRSQDLFACVSRVLRTEAGEVVLVMELLGGRTLEAAIADGERAGPTALGRFLARVTGALTWLHKRGRVHGRLEPRKLWLDPARSVEDARLLDTTLAELALVRAPDAAWCAPEQLADPTRAPDERADLYALGKIAQALRTSDERSPVDALIAELVHADPRKRPTSAMELGQKLSAVGFPAPQGSLRPVRRSIVPGVELPTFELARIEQGTREALRVLAHSPEAAIRALVQSEEAVRASVMVLVQAAGLPRRRRWRRFVALSVVVVAVAAVIGWQYSQGRL